MSLPPPTELGLPDKFSSWRPRQADLVVDVLSSDTRFSVLEAATGAGKSLTYVSVAHILGGRWAILTSTKGLQDQLIRDFSTLGLVDIRGQGNYDCPYLTVQGQMGMADVGPCHSGMKCEYKDSGCPYFDAVKRAKKSSLVITNYSYWLAFNHYSEDGLGQFDGLILDEAHESPEEVAGFLTIDLTPRMFDVIRGPQHPSHEADLSKWQLWAAERSAVMHQEVEGLKAIVAGGDSTQNDRRRLRELKGILTALKKIATLKGEWIIDRDRGGSIRFDPLWPAPYVEDLLFLGIKRVIFSSATVRPKTLDLLGVPQDQVTYFDTPSSFPIVSRPVIHLPTVRVDNRWTCTDQKWWLLKIDQILKDRQDRKGIIHTVSYDRRTMIMESSRYRDTMISNTTRSTHDAVQTFKESKAPSVFVSPSVTTGYDFPYEQAEFQILAKVPFPDTRSKILARRCEADPSYPHYLAMQTIVQSCGRGMRAPDDRCETLIIDDHFWWFVWKHKQFAPQWWLSSVKQCTDVPKPLPKLPRMRK